MIAPLHTLVAAGRRSAPWACVAACLLTVSMLAGLGGCAAPPVGAERPPVPGDAAQPSPPVGRSLSSPSTSASTPLAVASASTTPSASASRPVRGQPSSAMGQPSNSVRDDASPDAVTYGHRPDVQQFAAEVASRHGLDAAAVQALLGQARSIPTVTRLVMPAPTGTAKNWAAYRRRFVEPARIAAGLAFWQDNARWLELAEQRYGVPPDIVVGVIGVETDYGRYVGSFRQIDALATLAFDFPSGRSDRRAYFQRELETWLVAHLPEGDAALSIKSSYAGARGLPQFMPSSEQRLGVDFDGDGRVDLANSPADAIGSVANYLASYGWVRGLPTHHAVQPPEQIAQLALLLAPDIVPSFNTAELLQAGARIDTAGIAADDKLALVRLDNADDPPTYVAGTPNFYAITRYNQSSYYALAVIELGAAVKAAR